MELLNWLPAKMRVKTQRGIVCPKRVAASQSVHVRVSYVLNVLLPILDHLPTSRRSNTKATSHEELSRNDSLRT